MRSLLFSSPAVMLATAALLAVAGAAGCGRTEPTVPRGELEEEGEGGEPEGDGGLNGPCRIVVSPPRLDFGQVPIDTSRSDYFQIMNASDFGCRVTNLVLAPSSDPGFRLRADQPHVIQMPPQGIVEVPVTFEAADRARPRKRTGEVTFRSPQPDAGIAVTAVPLEAEIALGCALAARPAAVDFGKVRFNTSAGKSVSLVNEGTSDCVLSVVGLEPGTSPLFVLPDLPSQQVVGPDESFSVGVSFSATDPEEPRDRTGTLAARVTQPSGVPLNPPVRLEVPLHAVIDTECVGGSRNIYTVDDEGMLSIFDPENLVFHNLWFLPCGDPTGPFSMAVDQKAVAWVEYNSGNIYRVDTRSATPDCKPTAFVPDPSLSNFGMSFVFQPSTGVDTLYVAGGPEWGSVPTRLGVISFPTMTLLPLGHLPDRIGAPELTGTGDGQLWGFTPSFVSPYGMTALARIDPVTRKLLTVYEYPELNGSPSSWALKFWGGSFWLFLGSSVYEVPRATGLLKTAVTNTGHRVVGAGVSTCAPLD